MTGDRAGPLARILYVGTLPPHPGGTAISAYQLLLALARRGHPVACLSPVTPDTRHLASRWDTEHTTLEVSRYELPRFDLGEPDASRPDQADIERQALYDHMPKLIEHRRPAVVIAGRESFGWDVPELARRHGVPSMLLLRGGAPTARLLTGGEPPERVREAVRKFGVAQRLIAVSGHLAAGFARLGLTGIDIIPNHVDLKRFAPRPRDPRLLTCLEIPPGSVVAAFVAVLKRRKRPLDVVASAALAARDPRLVYIVVGDGPERETMKRMCATEGLADRFRFVGWVDYERVPAYLALADLVLMPSEAEGMARIYLETQAAGRTLVASDIPPAREVIEHGETGLLFPLGDTQAFATRVLDAAADASLRAYVGARARERVRPHDLESVTWTYSDAIQELAAGSHGSAGSAVVGGR